MLYIFITSINVYFFFPRWHIKRGVREEQLDESRCQVRDGTLIIANVQQSDAGNAFTDFSQTEVEFSKFLFPRNRHSLVVRGAAKLFKLFAPTSHGDRNKEAPRHSLIFTFATITTKSGTDGLGLRTEVSGAQLDVTTSVPSSTRLRRIGRELCQTLESLFSFTLFSVSEMHFLELRNFCASSEIC